VVSEESALESQARISTGADWLVEDLVQVSADPPKANPQVAAEGR